MIVNRFSRIALWGAAVLVSSTALAHPGHEHKAQTPNASVAEAVSVSHCWIRLMPSPAPSAGYFLIDNAGSQDITLQGAQTDAFGMMMLHQTTHKDGTSRMSEVPEVVVPAGKSLEFKPGSYHAMLEDPVESVKVGSTIDVNFLFSSGKNAVASCEVKAPSTLPASHGHQHH